MLMVLILSVCSRIQNRKSMNITQGPGTWILNSVPLQAIEKNILWPALLEGPCEAMLLMSEEVDAFLLSFGKLLILSELLQNCIKSIEKEQINFLWKSQ